jgi:hypothetical protein
MEADCCVLAFYLSFGKTKENLIIWRLDKSTYDQNIFSNILKKKRWISPKTQNFDCNRQ